MDRVEMIKCLCYQGNVENTGVYQSETDSYEDINCQFGTGNSRLVIDGEVKMFTTYLYAYQDRLTHPDRGEIGADVVLTNYEGENYDRIYLYEIE